MSVKDIRYVGYGLPEVEAERVFHDEASWKPQVFAPGQSVLDQWGTGVRVPNAIPHTEPNKGFFQATEV
jgi:hypothetical protein